MTSKLQSALNGKGPVDEPLITHAADMAKVLEDKEAFGAVYKPTTDQIDIKQSPKYVGLSKEELERYVNDPYWKKLRYAFLFVFWFAWVGMFLAAIAIVLMSPKCPPKPDRHWWQKKICYQIWTRSFKDSNADGIGDFNGISEKVSVLDTALRTSAIWPVPLLKSARGGGYDVTDYKNVDPALGTMADFENLINTVHKHDMHMVMDIPLAIVSVEHEWFKKSVARDGEFENYFVWLENGQNKSEYKYVAGRGSYRHWGNNTNYAVLNWESQSVREAMQDVVKFWIDKNVDGFYLGEVQLIASNPDGTPDWDSIHARLKTLTSYMREVAGQRKIMTFTSHYGYESTYGINKTAFKSGVKLYGDVDYVINNELVSIDANCGAACMYNHLNDAIEFQARFNSSWPMWEVGHPYVSRLASRLGGRDRADLIMMLLMTLPGSVNVYAGDEIGMRNTDAPGVSKFNIPRGAMQWSADKNAGASDADKMAVPPNSDYPEVNFKAQQSSDSSLKMFKRLAGLRRSEDAFLYGDIKLGPKSNDMLVVRASSNHSTTDFLTLLNFGDKKEFNLESEASPYYVNITGKEPILVTMTPNLAQTRAYKDRQVMNLTALALGPNEGVVIKLKSRK